MRNLFQEGTYQAGIGMGSPGGSFRPFRMGQVQNWSEGVNVGQAGFTGQGQAVDQKGEEGQIGEQAQSATVVGSGHHATEQAVNSRKPLPMQPDRPRKLDNKRNRFEWTVGRLCSIMRSFSEDSIAAEVQSQVFWSYVKQADSSEESVLTAYKTLCPELTVPVKPVSPDKELVSEPGKGGFHGKTTISYAEAVELNTALTEVLRPLTPEEAASAIGKEQCLRDFAAGNFPKLERLQDDLQTFIDAGDTGATFTISKGDIVVAGKAIDCAVALGRGKIIKNALVTGGVIGAGALLLFLL